VARCALAWSEGDLVEQAVVSVIDEDSIIGQQVNANNG